jgi:hypothetical protein
LAGKAKVSRNAVRHGLTAKLVIVMGEEQQDFEAFEADLVEGMAPVGALERLLVERIVLAGWRVRRVARLEMAHATYQAERMNHSISKYGGHDGQSAVGVEGSEVGARVAVLLNLSRYEAALERSLYRALHEFERARAARQGELVPVPAVLDLEAGEFVSQNG